MPPGVALVVAVVGRYPLQITKEGGMGLPVASARNPAGGRGVRLWCALLCS
jgi:hypothetical protein